MPQRYFIGQFPFVSMSGFPLGETTDMEIEARPGVDGLYFWNLGKRGKPFTVQTVADVLNVFSAGVLMTQYEQMIGQVVPVMFAGSYMPKRYCVLGVTPQPDGVKQILLGVGGTTNGLSGGLVIADWTLAATPMDLQGSN